MGVTINGIKITAEDAYISDDLTVGDDVTIDGDITLTSGGTITTTANGNFVSKPHGTGISVIGDAGSTSHSLNSPNDLHVTGKLEIDGDLFADNGLQCFKNLVLSAGYALQSDANVGAIYMNNSAQTPDNVSIGLGGTSRVLLIHENADAGTDFGQVQRTDPTMIMHSSDSSDLTEYSELSWNNHTIGAGNGAFAGLKWTASEEVTISIGQGAGGVNTSGNLAPANSLILSAVAIITDAPGGGATTLDIGITAGDADALIDGMSTALDTTGNTPADGNSGAQMPISNGSATTLTLTTDANVTDDEMKVRVAICYIEFTPFTKSVAA